MTPAKSRKKLLEAKRCLWKQHIEDWQTGELSQAEYCRKHHLKIHRVHLLEKEISHAKNISSTC